MTKVASIPNTSGDRAAQKTAGPAARDFLLHRLGEVRRREGVSLRTVAHHLGTSVTDVKFQELRTTDLPLSILYEWREVLGVPVTELLVEPDDSLSLPLMKRAQLVRLMKTAMSILEQSHHDRIKRFAQNMVNQLVEIMPELHEIGSWHLVGKRRPRDEYGQVAQRVMSEEVFLDQPE